VDRKRKKKKKRRTRIEEKLQEEGKNMRIYGKMNLKTKRRMQSG
jgi:formate-dependent phosphoribosylglycinamide formyltransferase (GAR transformylase)